MKDGGPSSSLVESPDVPFITVFFTIINTINIYILPQQHLAPAATSWLLQSHLGSSSHELALAATYQLLHPHINS